MPSSNLAPKSPSGWDDSLVISNASGLRHNTGLTVGDDVFLSWAIGNDGPRAIDDEFYVDLLFDGIVVNRWTSDGASTRLLALVSDWSDLTAQVRVTPGAHTMTLVVDSTDRIVETDESDNTFEREFVWDGEDPGFPVAARLPDLAPVAPEDWGGPIVATSYQGDTVDSPLSVSVPAYIGYAIENRGLSSISENVWVHLYLDDVLVDLVSWEGFLVDAVNARPDWPELYETTDVSAGEHTLRLVVDPNNLVVESDELNNVFERVYTWGEGAIPGKPVSVESPLATAPAPLTLPNLVPGWWFGSDGPIVVSSVEGTDIDSSLVAGETVFLDLTVFNQSAVAAQETFAVDLYFDGDFVESFELDGGIEGGVLRFFLDWDGLAEATSPSPGDHTLTLVIDPSNAVVESNETDNVFEKTVTWSEAEAPPAEPIKYSASELAEMLGSLRALVDDMAPVVSADSDAMSSAVLVAADAGYFILTGTSLRDERVDISLTTHAGYLDWLDENFAVRFALEGAGEYEAILAVRERFKTESNGFKTRRNGKIALVVDGERPFAEVLNSLAHEIGHMRQDFLNPAQTDWDGPTLSVNAIQEAGAQQFERVFWLALEDFTGLSLLSYPDFDGFPDLIDRRLTSWLGNLDAEEHAIGRLLQWLAVLDDPQLAHLGAELDDGVGLSTASALEVYEYLVDLPPEAAADYVNARFESLASRLGAIESEANGRLISGLDLDLEGPAALRVPGLLAP